MQTTARQLAVADWVVLHSTLLIIIIKSTLTKYIQYHAVFHLTLFFLNASYFDVCIFSISLMLLKALRS